MPRIRLPLHRIRIRVLHAGAGRRNRAVASFGGGNRGIILSYMNRSFILRLLKDYFHLMVAAHAMESIAALLLCIDQYAIDEHFLDDIPLAGRPGNRRILPCFCRDRIADFAAVIAARPRRRHLIIIRSIDALILPELHINRVIFFNALEGIFVFIQQIIADHAVHHDIVGIPALFRLPGHFRIGTIVVSARAADRAAAVLDDGNIIRIDLPNRICNGVVLERGVRRKALELVRICLGIGRPSHKGIALDAGILRRLVACAVHS